jgi:hypothetical protein
LWKLHGDVADTASEWIYPYEQGRVFKALLTSLDKQLSERPPSHALIIGYSEYEPVVKKQLISWLQKNVSNVLRVRPNWKAEDSGGLQDTAKRFFQRLSVYLELEHRADAA